MTISDSILSYTDCLDVFEKALADLRGIRIKFATKAAAVFFRMRAHTARNLDRKRNRMIYSEEPTNPLYGRSMYDKLIVRLKEDEEAAYLYIEHLSADHLEIENISEIAEEEDKLIVESIPEESELLVQSLETKVVTPIIRRRF